MKITVNDLTNFQCLFNQDKNVITYDDIIQCFSLSGVLDCDILDSGKVFKVTFITKIGGTQNDIDEMTTDITNIIGHASIKLADVETNPISRNGCVATFYTATFKKEITSTSDNIYQKMTDNEKVNDREILSPREAWETLSRVNMNIVPRNLIEKVNEAILGSIHNKLNQVSLSIPKYQEHYGDLLIKLLYSKGYTGVAMSRNLNIGGWTVFFNTPECPFPDPEVNV